MSNLDVKIENADVKAAEKTENGKKEKKVSIKVLKHAEFKGDIKTDFTTTGKLAEEVSSLFASVFADYYGCKIGIVDGTQSPAIDLPYGSFYVDLYFKDMGDMNKGIKNLTPVGGKKSGEKESLAERFARVNGAAMSGKAYTVSKETYEALEPFTYTGRAQRWSARTLEFETPTSIYGKSEVVVCIAGLSLNKIITAIYGGETEEGRYDYATCLQSIIPGTQNTVNKQYLVSVVKLDLAMVRDLQKTMGTNTINPTDFYVYSR